VEEAVEEEALEEEALEEEAMVAHQTGTGPQIGGKQARRRSRNTSKSWKTKMKMMKSLQSQEIQEKGACRGEDTKSMLTKGSRLRYLVAFCTFFNRLIKHWFLFFNEQLPETFSLLNHCGQVFAHRRTANNIRDLAANNIATFNSCSSSFYSCSISFHS
jgi:hypothetical protein